MGDTTPGAAAAAARASARYARPSSAAAAAAAASSSSGSLPPKRRVIVRDLESTVYATVAQVLLADGRHLSHSQHPPPASGAAAAGGGAAAAAALPDDGSPSSSAAPPPLPPSARTACCCRWVRGLRESTKFDVMLGDRNHLPWARLGLDRNKLQLVNYYRGSQKICKKASLVRTLRAYCARTNRTTEDLPWLPESFILQPDALIAKEPAGERERLEAAVAAAAARDQHIWIVKSTAGAKGDGILISDSLEEIYEFVRTASMAHVVQKYIENPLLLPGNRKFDIRCWVLLDPHYRAYLYREGVLRTASDPYRPDDLKDVTSHLTNHCIQERLSSNFGAFEEGNEMFFEEFDAHLSDTRHCCLESSILPQIRHIIRECFAAMEPSVRISAEDTGYLSFQLFGFDFMLDTDLQVLLVEINGAPAAAERLREAMAEDIVRSAVDPIFCPGGPPLTDRPNAFQLL